MRLNAVFWEAPYRGSVSAGVWSSQAVDGETSERAFRASKQPCKQVRFADTTAPGRLFCSTFVPKGVLYGV